MIEKLPVGVDQPGLPDAIGETKLTFPPSIRYALCSERLMIILVPERTLEALIKPAVTGTRVTTRSWLAHPVASAPKSMTISTFLSIYHLHLGIDSTAVTGPNRDVRSNLASQSGRLTNILNIARLNHLLLYSSRCVAVALTYVEKGREVCKGSRLTFDDKVIACPEGPCIWTIMEMVMRC